MKKNYNEMINNLKCEILSGIDVEFAKFNREKVYLNIPSDNTEDVIFGYLSELTQYGDACQFIPKYIEKENVIDSLYKYRITYDRVIWDDRFEKYIDDGEHVFFVGMHKILSSINVYNAIYQLLTNEEVIKYNNINN